MSLFRDEKGKASLARVLLLVTVLYVFVLILLDAYHKLGIGTAIWGLLSGLVLTLIGWAAGPRLAQHLFPQLGAFVSSIGGAKKTAREPNLYRDDERGGVGQ